MFLIVGDSPHLPMSEEWSLRTLSRSDHRKWLRTPHRSKEEHTKSSMLSFWTLCHNCCTVGKPSILCIRSFHISNKCLRFGRILHFHCTEHNVKCLCSEHIQQWQHYKRHIDWYCWWYPRRIDLSHHMKCKCFDQNMTNNCPSLCCIERIDFPF